MIEVGTGLIARWYTISCGSCDASDAFAPEKDQGRREATYKWAQDGWRTERADDERPESWWCCPACVQGARS